MTEAAPEQVGAAAEKKRPLLRRVPTSVIVTLLGIALTAWLLPAFTRQWDDRQKARQLKVSIVREMASATGSAVTDLRGQAAVLRGERYPVTGKLGPKEWSVASLRIQAVLSAYFGPDVVGRWVSFSEYMDVAFNMAYGHDVTSTDWGLIRSGPPDARPPRRSRHLERLLARFGKAPFSWYPQYFLLEAGLLHEEETITSTILAAHPVGYSTTAHDLIHDLIP